MDIWKNLIQHYRGRTFILQGNDTLLKERIKGYFWFILNQNSIPFVNSPDIIDDESKYALFGEENSFSIPGKWFLRVSSEGQGSRLPCWKKYRESNLRIIFKELALPLNLQDPFWSSNIQEQILERVTGFNLFKEERSAGQDFKYLLFQKGTINEEIWDLLSLL